ncbi:Metallo-dependent hydrolase [Violaceomyces palustris]|uniref:Metallo-dependent hydrolase n=1 Tax=Violaceomyces palustris TaxID=1673888 RepID=A0ACD0NRN8_9BASI|nr:Metallo-dependent hydrolase [Violaceomyces palustris]
MESYQTLSTPPESVWPRLFDVTHCHPADDPTRWTDRSRLHKKLEDSKLGTIVAMSTNFEDQDIVAEMATLSDGKVLPCFGYHPWFVHSISLRNPPLPKREHYQSIFGEKQMRNFTDDFEQVLPELADPVPIGRALAILRSNLERFPDAMLGEVGLDRAFRIPFKAWSYRPENEQRMEEGEVETPSSSSSCCCSTRKGHGEVKDLVEGNEGWRKGRRGSMTKTRTPLSDGRRLTKLQTPIEHQAAVLKAQIGVAVELGRNVSFHAVQCSGRVMDLMKELCMEHPGGFQNGFRDINLVLHSCTLDQNIVKSLQSKHSNLYFSFSTAINLRHKVLRDQIKTCRPERILSESDHHTVEGFEQRVWDVVKLIGDVLLGDVEEGGEDEVQRYDGVVSRLESNWRGFCRNASFRREQGSNEEEEDEVGDRNLGR